MNGKFWDSGRLDHQVSSLPLVNYVGEDFCEI